MSPSSQPVPPLKVAIVGAGTVGGGVLQLLRANAEGIAARCGRRIEVCAIAVRDLHKARARLSPAEALLLSAGWRQAATHPQADVVVELMGGEDEAGDCIKTALAAGKSVVTANKALLATHGDDVFAAARAAGRPLAFEAAVAGCIPIVKILREALAGDNIFAVAGIINGTCNYIITAMSENNMTFTAALAEAQARGYAEADPALDIDGIDAAHKIILIAQLAFNARPTTNDFSIVGLRDFSLRDIRYAAQFGFCIKLLAQAQRVGDAVALSVQPTLVPKEHPLSTVSGPMNAVLVRSLFAGETLYYGAGAGGAPTATAVAADLIDIARGHKPLSVMPDNGTAPPLTPPEAFSAPHFLRLRVLDKPGALANIAHTLAEQNISIEAIHQNESAPGQEVDIIMLLHETARGQVTAAVRRIEQEGAVFGKIVIMPIQKFC